MSTPDITPILEELAAGRIDAAEAARRIDAMKASTAQSTPGPEQTSSPEPTNEEIAAAGEPTDPWAAASDRPQRPGSPTDDLRETVAAESGATSRPRTASPGGVERVSVRAVGRRVRIVGETAVATLSADGPHVLRRNGSVLEVSSDGELGSSLDGFSILKAPRSLDDIRALGLGKELLLKVNPAIIVDVELTAGSLHTERVPHLGKIRVTAGGAKLLDVHEINDALVQAGQATIKGSIISGRNRVRAESGSLAITLGDDTNATIKGDAQLGRVSWSGGHSGAGDEVVMGNGSARLDIEVVMGHAQVRVGSDRPAEAGAR